MPTTVNVFENASQPELDVGYSLKTVVAWAIVILIGAWLTVGSVAICVSHPERRKKWQDRWEIVHGWFVTKPEALTPPSSLSGKSGATTVADGKINVSSSPVSSTSPSPAPSPSPVSPEAPKGATEALSKICDLDFRILEMKEELDTVKAKLNSQVPFCPLSMVDEINKGQTQLNETYSRTFKDQQDEIRSLKEILNGYKTDIENFRRISQVLTVLPANPNCKEANSCPPDCPPNAPSLPTPVDSKLQ